MQSRNTRTCLRKRAHARKARSADAKVHACYTEFTSVDVTDTRIRLSARRSALVAARHISLNMSAGRCSTTLSSGSASGHRPTATPTHTRGAAMSSGAAEQPLPAADAPGRRRRRRTPPKWLWAVLVVLGLVGAIVQGTDVLGDHAFANIATWLLGLLAVVTLAVWFLFFSGHGRRSRLLVLAGCMAGVSLWPSCFGWSGVSGELMPLFAYRFSTKPDRLLQPPPEPAAGDARRTWTFARRPMTIFRNSSGRAATPSSTSGWPAIGRSGRRNWSGGTRSARAGRRSPWSAGMRSRWSSGANGKWSPATASRRAGWNGPIRPPPATRSSRRAWGRGARPPSTTAWSTPSARWAIWRASTGRPASACGKRTSCRSSA